jgi:protein TonB
VSGSAKKFKKMKTDERIPTWEDIIFEKRNKLYGAYELRTTYHNTLAKAFFTTIAAASIIFLFRINHSKPKIAETMDPVRDSIIFNVDYKIMEPVKRIQATAAVEHSTVPDEHSFTLVEDSVIEVVNDSALTAAVPDAPQDRGMEGNEATDAASGSSSSAVMLPVTTTYQLSTVDRVPDFPGGLEKFFKYLKTKIHYTKEAIAADLNAKMYVRFIVDEDGLISQVKVMKRIGYGLDEQVETVLMESPKWLPGMYRNNPVKTEMVLPVSFNLR